MLSGNIWTLFLINWREKQENVHMQPGLVIHVPSLMVPSPEYSTSLILLWTREHMSNMCTDALVPCRWSSSSSKQIRKPTQKLRHKKKSHEHTPEVYVTGWAGLDTPHPYLLPGASQFQSFNSTVIATSIAISSTVPIIVFMCNFNFIYSSL